MMAPAFERVAAHCEPQVRFGKVNTDNEPMIAQRFGIRSIPTLIVFKGGQEIGRQAGAMDFGTLVQWVQAHTADTPKA
jgi:thioredoxin 2